MKESGVEAREIAIQCLYRIDKTDSFANIILPNLLKGKSLHQRDKNLITEIDMASTPLPAILLPLLDLVLKINSLRIIYQTLQHWKVYKRRVFFRMNNFHLFLFLMTRIGSLDDV